MYLKSQYRNPLNWDLPTLNVELDSASSSVNSLRCDTSESTVDPNSRVLLNVISFLRLPLRFRTFRDSKYFIRGIVPPPKTIVVNKTTTNVVVTRTFRVSSANSKCKLRAYAMAPRSPLNHMINIIFFVI